MGPRNITVGCWELNLNLSLHVQLFEHLTVIFMRAHWRRAEHKVISRSWFVSHNNILMFTLSDHWTLITELPKHKISWHLQLHVLSVMKKLTFQYAMTSSTVLQRRGFEILICLVTCWVVTNSLRSLIRWQFISICRFSCE